MLLNPIPKRTRLNESLYIFSHWVDMYALNNLLYMPNL